ncbi:hypothetical protein [Nonomuraea gerenzanensis]|uniref:Uncharacterized protein n=1 Tax=Nonomuraea gerenzanensis TaxID=93944 RepID=A0A1M4EBJ0_9ACTN|nr:hypothetical protein [Nonomuraea gerenzanensis]UBU18337.1 hypothetical protein LCN96_25940 [Nonomuraea gerenzanensis]SBO96164.1 hypothetical protein BN4615_P5680 [Nonomuraea gerenzanensis]
MTRYAVDHHRNVLISSWSTGSGDIATDVTDLPAGLPRHDALNLARTLTQLSEVCWRCYTHPASAADSHEPGSEGERRQEERDAFAGVLTALTNPDLPPDGYLIQSAVRVEEAAHQAGRALHALGAAEPATRVTLDVGAELAAIEQAELGNLTGRARQAVTLTREDASPVQVAQASSLLHDHPFGPEAIFTEIDPAAAAIAAAHWLHAAATVTAGYAGLPATQIVAEADTIEALPHATPTLVLELMADGASPRQAVMPLIRDALRIAEGEIPDLPALHRRIAAAERLLDARREDQPEPHPDVFVLRLTPLDPARPALDLLEDLLGGIRGCWLLYAEYATELDGTDLDGTDFDGTGLDDEERQRRHTASFCAEVRQAAAAQRERLL